MRPFKATLLCILTWPLLFSASAKTVGESAYATDLPLDSFTEQCVVEVMSHPLGQGLANHDYDEYVEFCTCLKDKTQKKNHENEFSGQGPEMHLSSLDRCAAISLSKGNLERYFLILLTTKFELFVYEHIVGRFPAGTTTMASPSSIDTRTTCIQKNILSKCSKVHAFALTYQCIQDVFQTPDLYSRASALCPSFSTEEVPLTGNPGDKML